MAWKETTEDPDRYINTDQCVWANVTQNGSNWDLVVYAVASGQFVIGTYGTKAAAETALAVLIATF